MYYKSFKRFIPIAVLGVLMVASVVVLELNQIDYMGKIINEGVSKQDLNVVLKYGIIMTVWAILAGILGVFGTVCASVASNGFAIQLRERLYHKIQSFSIKNVSRFSSASLITRLTNDINYLQQTIMMCLRMLVRAPMMLISSMFFIYLTSKEIASIMIVPILVLGTALVFIISKGGPRFVAVQTKLDQLNRSIQEALINIRVIKSFVREDFEEDRFSLRNDDNMQTNIWAQNLMMLINPLMMLVLNITTVAMLYVCSFFVLEKNMLEIGSIVVILNYIRFTLFSLMMISQVLTMVSRSRASVTRISAVFSTPEVIESPAVPVVPETVKGQVIFDHVTFEYYDDQIRKTLTDINLVIEPGERFGIIGSTGCGKTTLVNLLARLIEPSSGQVLFDGVNVNAFDLHTLRSFLGFVPQKNVLFTGSIRDNLKLGNQSASDAVLDEAAKTAAIYDFIHSSPEGYDGHLNQGGLNLSGGQRQRMCIARALVVSPKVLVLDDSTSALDAETEKGIKDALSLNHGEMTLISIAQKISSVADCDRICVMDDGKIVGLGTHEDLLASNPIYQEIYQSQMSRGAIA